LKKEADQIREQAKLERRPVSNYILNIMMRWVTFEERLYVQLDRFGHSRTLADREIEAAA